MSNIPDEVLQRTIVNGIRFMRQNPNILDSVFAGQTAEQRDQIKQWLLESNLQLSLNFPRKQQLTIPAIVMTLLSDSESDGLIGDHVMSGTSPELLGTGGNNFGTVSTTGGLPSRIISNVQVDRTEEIDDNTRIYWEDIYSPEIANAFADRPDGCYNVYVVRGAGRGQIETITRISNNFLDIEGTFDQQLDSSSYLDIRRADEVIAEGQPPRLFTEEDDLTTKGAYYEARYKLHVLGSTQLEVLFLYSILKAILLSQRVYLEKQGLHGLGVQGAEFAPLGEYLPDICYGRAMTLTFKYLFCYTEPLETYDTLQINLTTSNTFTGGDCGLLEIEIDI